MIKFLYVQLWHAINNCEGHVWASQCHVYEIRSPRHLRLQRQVQGSVYVIYMVFIFCIHYIIKYWLHDFEVCGRAQAGGYPHCVPKGKGQGEKGPGAKGSSNGAEGAGRGSGLG